MTELALQDRSTDSWTPKELVVELDRYIVGQHDAKRAVAIALRNRWRRRQVDPDLRDEIMPKNIIMIGPTGVGKTEIARRLAKLARAPFFKVEASKFTEVGYVGRDVESMIRDLAEVSIKLVSEEELVRVEDRARQAASERILDALLPGRPRFEEGSTDVPVNPSTREKLAKLLADGHLDDREVEFETSKSTMPVMEVFSNSGMEEMGINLKDTFSGLFPKQKKKKRMKVSEAMEVLSTEEGSKLIDSDKVAAEAVRRVQEDGIIFLDEIDKVTGRQTANSGPDVSREGVQRDLLPIVEGSTVKTKHGMIRTDHILFIAAGAFHVSDVSDMIPELQGRFPIRVQLQSLEQEDFLRILTEPENSLVRQYVALLATEGVTLVFTDDGNAEIARMAWEVNERQENIGARRLHTVMERLLDKVSFDAPDMAGVTVTIDETFVRAALADVIEDPRLERYIL